MRGDAGPAGQPIGLTAREKEILRCLAEGLPTAAIGKKLFISPVTVRNHVQNLLQKLDVHTKLAGGRVRFPARSHLRVLTSRGA